MITPPATQGTQDAGSTHDRAECIRRTGRCTRWDWQHPEHPDYPKYLAEELAQVAAILDRDHYRRPVSRES